MSHPAKPYAEIEVEGDVGVLRAQHFRQGLRLKYLLLAGAAPGEHHFEESAHVEHAGIQATGRHVA
jgi:hypothetical protein